jgi:kinetochore protein Nuf2
LHLLLTLQDIHKPEPARLRRHLSALINFAKFREEKLVVYRCVSAGVVL